MDLISFVPQFGGFVQMIVAFVVALSIIVAIHEYGHYIVGRWSGIDADVFSLGFGPVLYSRMDRRGTLWQIAALPFGGYVKFKGDANASGGMDAEAMSDMGAAERRRTMNGAPLWARSATVAAGPLFNFALSILVFAGIFMVQGRPTDPVEVGTLRTLPIEQGLQKGDQILAIEGEAVPRFDQPAAFDVFLRGLPRENQLEYTVLRAGQQLAVPGPYVYPPIATAIVPQSAASDAGMEAGDLILTIDGTEISAFEDLRHRVESSEGAGLQLQVWRDGGILDLVLTPKQMDEPQPDGGFKTVYRIGIVGGWFFEPATSTPSFVSALGDGAAQTYEIIRGSLSGLWHMITGSISTCNLSGPIGIAQTSGEMASQGTTNFIWFIALLSTAVGLINLFPIPVLDGGHLCFFAYEAVSGRPPSDMVLRVLMSIGLGLILLLMILGTTSDLFCP
ncbi:MAG: RIP metalloprotease RseP [Rhodobacteraceae bacterium]|nr:RIP metalloprotease RseP [Paracoccaceae bacterium]